MKHLLTAALIATVFASPVTAEPNLIFTVQDYYQECDPSRRPVTGSIEESMQAGICIGVAQGIASSAHVNCEMSNIDTPYIFRADLDGSSVGARRQAMWNFAQANPSMWSDPVGILIMGLSETWPCRN
ncbi:hypothetical protein FZCC0069_09055 [Rhodobacterales bacterium FZCC0069]|nr:hypothetical protein [Rhodobacterales bacterium FZCC0069]